MDILLKARPGNDAERKARNIAVFGSMMKGECPYARSLGLRGDLDASAAGAASVILGKAAEDIPKIVKGAKISQGKIAVDSSGRARLIIKAIEG